MTSDRLSFEELAALRASRPRTRKECLGGPLPFPFVGCRYNLQLDIAERGELCINRNEEVENVPQRQVTIGGCHRIPQTHGLESNCALDFADAAPGSGWTLQVVA